MLLSLRHRVCCILLPKQDSTAPYGCLLIRASSRSSATCKMWTRKVLSSLTQRSQQHIRTRALAFPIKFFHNCIANHRRTHIGHNQRGSFRNNSRSTTRSQIDLVENCSVFEEWICAQRMCCNEVSGASWHSTSMGLERSRVGCTDGERTLIVKIDDEEWQAH